MMNELRYNEEIIKSKKSNDYQNSIINNSEKPIIYLENRKNSNDFSSSDESNEEFYKNEIIKNINPKKNISQSEKGKSLQKNILSTHIEDSITKIDNIKEPKNERLNFEEEEEDEEVEDGEKNSQILEILLKFKTKKFLNQLNLILKSIYIIQRIKKIRNDSASKITSLFFANSIRKKFKENYLFFKILKSRDTAARTIASNLKMIFVYKRAKKMLRKAKTNYIIYSSIKTDTNKLSFKCIINDKKKEDLKFEYSSLFKCFIAFIDKKIIKEKTVIAKGYFDDGINYQLTDKQFQINDKGQNVIDLHELKHTYNLNTKKISNIAKDYINKSDEQIKHQNSYSNKKQKNSDSKNYHKELSDKLKILPKSKSLIKMKETFSSPKLKSILKPVKSYIKIPSNEEKKITFVAVKIKKFHIDK